MAYETLSEKSLKSAICDMIGVKVTNQGFEVELPQIYHTGHVASVVVRAEGGGFYIHDNGYAALLLTNLGKRVSKKKRAELQDMVEHYGCNFEGMKVFRKCDRVEHIGVAATLVGCASRLIADQGISIEDRPIFDFKAMLLGKVSDAFGQSRIRTNRQVFGHRGSVYKVSTMVLDSTEAKPIAIFEPINDRDAIARRFKEFYDIKTNPEYTEVARVAVVNDGIKIPAGDSLLIQEVGHIVSYENVETMFTSMGTMQ